MTSIDYTYKYLVNCLSFLSLEPHVLCESTLYLHNVHIPYACIAHCTLTLFTQALTLYSTYVYMCM